MKDLLDHVDGILSFLPFNGDKTALSAGLKLLLPVLIAQFPPLLAVAPLLDALSTIGIGLGMAHKAVKAFTQK